MKLTTRSPRAHRMLSCCATIALAAGMALSGPASAETLEDALAAAYGSNPTLQAARAEQRATDESVAQALSGWRPSVEVEGTAAKTNSEGHLSSLTAGTTDYEDDRTSWTGTVTVSQYLFRGGQTLASTRSAKAAVLAGRENLDLVEQSVLLDVVRAYMDVLRDAATVELNRNNVQVLQRQLDASNDRFDVGEITRTDVAQSEARLSRSRSLLIQAEAQLTVSRAAYERLVGMAPGSLEASPEIPDLPATEEEALALAITEHPQLLAARFAEKSTRQEIRRAKGQLLPELALQGEYGHAEEPSSTIADTDSASVTAVLTVPLYQSGSVYSQVREAKQLNSQSRLQIYEAQRAVEEGVHNAWEALRAARSTTESSREQVRANEIALDGVRQELQVGSRTTLDVLDAEQELLDSRVSLVTAERDTYVAAYQLLSAVGRLNAAYLALPVDIYDPADNYERVHDKWFGYGIANEPDEIAVPD